MNKKKRRWMAGVFTVTMLMTGISASAVHITLDGGTIILPLSDTIEENAVVNKVTLHEFGLLGYEDNTHLIIGTGDGISYVTVDTIKEILPEFKIPELPNVREISRITWGSEPEKIKKIQEELIELKYLEGEADGVLGYKTETAIATFQTDYKLEVTGEAGARTALLLEDLTKQAESIVFVIPGDESIITEETETEMTEAKTETETELVAETEMTEAKTETETELVAETEMTEAKTETETELVAETEMAEEETETETEQYMTLEEKFSAIINQTSVDLTPYQEWKFSFDPFEQIGILDPGIILGVLDEGSTDMDRMNVKVSLKVRSIIDYVTEEYIMIPVFEITTSGSYRPNIKGAQLNVGNMISYLTESISDSKLDGINVVETAYVTIEDDAMQFIKDETNEKGILRVLCQDTYLDVSLDLSGIWCREVLPEWNDYMMSDEDSEVWNN